MVFYLFFSPFIIFGEWCNWAQTLKSHANSIKAGNATFIFVSVSDRGSFGKYSVLFIQLPKPVVKFNSIYFIYLALLTTYIVSEPLYINEKVQL